MISTLLRIEASVLFVSWCHAVYYIYNWAWKSIKYVCFSIDTSRNHEIHYSIRFYVKYPTDFHLIWNDSFIVRESLSKTTVSFAHQITEICFIVVKYELISHWDKSLAAICFFTSCCLIDLYISKPNSINMCLFLCRKVEVHHSNQMPV